MKKPNKKVQQIEPMEQMEQFIEELNKTLMPISNEIEGKLKFLQDYIGDTEEYPFTEITIEDLK